MSIKLIPLNFGTTKVLKLLVEFVWRYLAFLARTAKIKINIFIFRYIGWLNNQCQEIADLLYVN
jgi:hypothetical protein